MVNLSNYNFEGTTLEIVETHNFYLYKGIYYDEYQCINCKIILVHNLLNNMAWFETINSIYNSVIVNSTNFSYTCDEYLIRNILL